MADQGQAGQAGQGPGQIPLAARKARFNRWIDDRPGWRYGQRGLIRAAIARANTPDDLLGLVADVHGTTLARVRRARLGTANAVP